MTLMSGAQRQTLYRIHHPTTGGAPAEKAAGEATETEPHRPRRAAASPPASSAPVSEDRASRIAPPPPRQ